MREVTSDTLPLLVPMMNLITSVISLLMAVYLTERRRRRVGFDRFTLLGATLCIAMLLLVAGALFNATVLSAQLWIVIGTGGRIAMLVVLTAVLTTKE